MSKKTVDMSKFAVFILSHGRANEITTVNMLNKGNYTGDWFVVIDDEDDQADIYYEKFGKDKVIMFNKKEEADKTDTGDTENNRRVGVFARNRIEDLAIEMGYDYHIQLDDDFQGISFRYIDGKKLACKKCTNLDKLFQSMLNFLINTPTTWLSFSLSSDYLGGVKSKKYAEGLFRKTMGSFMMKSNDSVKFVMRMNDDITTTILNASKGKIMFSIAYLQVQTPETQSMKGGMTESYIDTGTYRKSFYSVMCCPSFVKISEQGIKHFRIHHKINWNNCCPKIISEDYKK